MTSPRRGRPATIDREAILTGALELIGRVGVEGLTMKALALELGVTPMATYRYVENKQALLELMIEKVLSREAPEAAGSWSEQLWGLLWANFEEVGRYPGLADYLYQGAVSPQGRRLLANAVQILVDAGIPADRARLAFSDIYAYMIGRLVLRARAFEQNGRTGSGRRGFVPRLEELASDDHIRHGYDALVRGLNLEFPDLGDGSGPASDGETA
ncbi:MAG: TetR/AcrR family transcriptional regulator [Aeromicrobium sp.]